MRTHVIKSLSVVNKKKITREKKKYGNNTPQHSTNVKINDIVKRQIYEHCCYLVTFIVLTEACLNTLKTDKNDCAMWAETAATIFFFRIMQYDLSCVSQAISVLLCVLSYFDIEWWFEFHWIFFSNFIFSEFMWQALNCYTWLLNYKQGNTMRFRARKQKRKKKVNMKIDRTSKSCNNRLFVPMNHIIIIICFSIYVVLRNILNGLLLTVNCFPSIKTVSFVFSMHNLS